MSQQPERKEKNCLNCGTAVIGRYCHVCGQENIVTRESFWSLTKHFVYDILHFDGKFWHTLKYLAVRPGIVAKEYCEGKRNSYLHPIRMYLFTSAIFFVLFFALQGNQMHIKEAPLTGKKRAEAIQDLQTRLQTTPGDTSLIRRLALLNDSTAVVFGSQLGTSGAVGFYMGNSAKYRSTAHYDSAQKALPKGERDGWISSVFTKRGLELQRKYQHDMRQGINLMLSDLLHKLPYMLFLSLPFFALILKLLYIRQKKFFYSDHAVFTLYHFIFSFILLLAMMLVNQVQKWTDLGWLDWAIPILSVTWLFYLLIELKNFYRQYWIKTVVKFLALNVMACLVLLFLFIIFILLSVFEA